MRNECKYCGIEISENIKSGFCSQICKSLYVGTRIKYNCDYCGKEDTKRKSAYDKTKYHYCSKECKIKGTSIFHSGENSANWKNRYVSFSCDTCGKTAETTRTQYDKCKYHYCSVECSNLGHSVNFSGLNNPRWDRITLECEICSKEIYLKKSEYDKCKHHYCSTACMGKHRIELYKGENHPNWNPNKTNQERFEDRKYGEYNDWRNNVFERDDYTCQCCGDNQGGNLNAHHLNSHHWDIENRTNVDNGITLCEDCHKDFHSVYGYKHNKKEEMEIFLKENKERFQSIS